MKFVGLDPSLTGTGIVKLDLESNIEEQKLISTKSSDKEEYRMSFILNEVNRIIDNDSVVYIEGLSHGSTGQSILEMAGLHYCITVNLYQRKITFKDIPPGTLKKFVTGNGRGKKNLMLLKTYKKFGIEFEDDNLCDAFCLAKLALEEHKK